MTRFPARDASMPKTLGETASNLSKAGSSQKRCKEAQQILSLSVVKLWPLFSQTWLCAPRSSLKVKGNTQGQDESRDPK